MTVYLHSSVSHTACGASWQTQPLEFVATANQSIRLQENKPLQFYAMAGLPVDATEQRLFSALSSAVSALIRQSGLSASELAQTALLLGSTSLDIGTLSPLQDAALGLPQIDRLSRLVQQEFALNPFHLVINTACTASLNAVIYAKKLIEHGGFKHVIVIGCEFYNHLTLAGFDSLNLLSEGQFKCFHRQRDGLILGEGVAALLLSTGKPARPTCYAIRHGYSSCDTFSLTMTAEDGSHIRSVIDTTLSGAGLAHAEVELIKVHGTATYNNDMAECQAIIDGFSKVPPIFSLKPFVGHTLGACGIVELALMDYLLARSFVPVAPYVIDEARHLMLDFASSQQPLAAYSNVLINHCGFGGNNAALLLETISA